MYVRAHTTEPGTPGTSFQSNHPLVYQYPLSLFNISAAAKSSQQPAAYLSPIAYSLSYNIYFDLYLTWVSWSVEYQL